MADAVALIASAWVNILRAQPEPTGGVEGERALFQDSVSFVVRDASGDGFSLLTSGVITLKSPPVTVLWQT